MEENKKVNIFRLYHDLVIPLFKKSKKLLIIPVLLGIAVFAISYITEKSKKPVYTTKITFMLEDEIVGDGPKGTSGGQILAALSGQSNSNNKGILVDLATSNKLVEETLLQEVNFEGKPEMLVNAYLRVMGYRDRWKKEKNEKWLKASYGKNYKIGQDKEMDYLLRSLSNEIKLALKPSVLESGLLTMNYSSSNELFTKLFLETHLTTISNFYVDKKVERAQSLVKFAKRKKDSILMLLTGKTYGLASMQDEGFGAVMRRSAVRQVQTQTDIKILEEQYGESAAALSAASIDLERRRPFISVVDDIRLPLDSEWPKPFKKSLGWGIIVTILGIAAVVGGFFGWDLLKAQKSEFEGELINHKTG